MDLQLRQTIAQRLKQRAANGETIKVLPPKQAVQFLPNQLVSQIFDESSDEEDGTSEDENETDELVIVGNDDASEDLEDDEEIEGWLGRK